MPGRSQKSFDPQRFQSFSKDSRHAFQFIPFGAGPRNCIGMRFALLEIKVALVRILMKHKFVESPETQVPLVIYPGATLSARDGVCQGGVCNLRVNQFCFLFSVCS